MQAKRIHNLQRRIYDELKSKAESYVGETSKELIEFKKKQEELGLSPFQESSHRELLLKISNASIVFVGDYHTFEQSQKNLIRIIRSLVKLRIPFQLGVELVQSKNQSILDAFLNHYITEMEFLELIDYHSSWEFPWTHYRSIFELAKKHQIKLIALNSPGNLKQRDQHAVKILKDVMSRNDILTLVQFGELHILQENLPSYFHNKNPVIIHQNLDPVFWSYEDSLSRPNIVRFNDDEFCILSSPPWLKYQSTVYWYESIFDDPDFDLHDYIIKKGLKTFGHGVHDLFYYLSSQMNKVFQLKLPKSQIEDFEIYDHTKFSYVQHCIESLPQHLVINFYLSLLSKNLSFKILDSNDYYCSEYSITKLSSLVGAHLFYKALEENNFPYDKIILKGSSNEKFPLFFYQHFTGYFISKIFNPHLKCDLYRDLHLKEQRYQTTSSEKKILTSSLQIIEKEGSISSLLKGSSTLKVFEQAKIIGEFFAETFFELIFLQEESSHSKKLQKSIFPKEPNLKNYGQLKALLFPNKKYKMRKKRVF